MKKTFILFLSILLAAVSIACSGNPYATQNQDPYDLAKKQLAALPEQYTPDQAASDGALVFSSGMAQTPLSIADDFISTTKKGVPDTLRIVQYTIEGDPVIFQIIFDGSVYHCLADRSRDAFAGDHTGIEEFTFSDLKQEWMIANEKQKDRQTEKVVYLTNVPDAEFDQLQNAHSFPAQNDLKTSSDFMYLYSFSTDTL